MSSTSHRRHRLAVNTAGQLDPGQLQPGLRPRGRGAGDEHRATLGGAAAGDCAGVVTGVALLLVGGIVLLVDDDQAEVVQRREDGRARPDADARLTTAQALPFVVALVIGEGRVQDREAVSEPRPEARHRLRRQADLGDQHDRPAAAGQRRLDRGEVDLGLAGASDAVQELLAPALGLAVDRGDDAPTAACRCSGSSRGRPDSAPTTGWSGRRRRCELRVAISSLASSRRRTTRSAPTAAARSAADISPPPRSASSTARCLTPSRSPPLSAASPAGAISARSSTRERTRWPPVPVPGGSTSCRPREGVEQYSRATQRPSSTSSGGAPASSASIGSARRSGGSSEALGPLDHDAEDAAVAEGDADDAADLEILHRLRQAVVERAAQGAGTGQRLDFGNRHLATVGRGADADVCWRR